MKNKILNFISDYGVYIAFVVIILFFSFSTSSFLTYRNIVDIADRIVVMALIAFGIALTLMVGGIDLSGGTIVGLVGIAAVSLIKAGVHPLLVILVVLGIGIIVGLINASLIAGANVNPFIATLVTLFVGGSLEKVVTSGGLPVYLWEVPGWFQALGKGKWLGIPNSVFLLLGIGILMYVLVHKAKLGREFYAIGENITTSRYSGIPTRIKLGTAYVISALASTAAGFVLASKFTAGQPMAGHTYLWDAIGAVYLGTIVSSRTRGSFLGTLFGAIFLGTTLNGLSLMGAGLGWLNFAKGAVILFLVLSWSMKGKLRDRAKAVG